MPKRNFAAGEVLTAANVNNYLTESKNLLLNSAFDIWQRGTSLTINSGAYSADRWVCGSNSTTITRDTDTPTNIGRYSLKIVATSANSIYQRIEAANIAHLAGQTVTLSFYYKRTSGTGNIDARAYYANSADNFGSVTQIGSTVILSASPSSTWTRYETSFALPANAANGLQILLNNDGNTTSFIAGVQLEEGSSSTQFARATNTAQAELAACQRYYWRAITGTGQLVGNSMTYSSTAGYCTVKFPVTMRVAPSIEVSSGTNHFQFEQNSGGPLVSTLNLGTFFGVDTVGVGASNAVGFSGTAGHAGWLRSFSADSRLSFTAEL